MNKEYIAKALILTGLYIGMGSIGACENEDCSLLQCIACNVCAAVLVVKGLKMGKEDL